MQEKFDRQKHKRYKIAAKNIGMKYFSVDVTGQGYPYNGFSIAYVPAVKSVNCRMINVSVSYCAEEDKFKAKRGKFQALHKQFETGEIVTLPLAEFYKDFGDKDLQAVLTSMFLV